MAKHNEFQSRRDSSCEANFKPGSCRRPDPRKLAEDQLRDIAYVLHLTRRIRAEILKEREVVTASN